MSNANYVPELVKKAIASEFGKVLYNLDRGSVSESTTPTITRAIRLLEQENVHIGGDQYGDLYRTHHIRGTFGGDKFIVQQYTSEAACVPYQMLTEGEM